MTAKSSVFTLHSNKMVFSDGVREAILLIRDGLIEEVIDAPAGDHSFGQKERNDLAFRQVDVGDLTVMPGLIDPHVHINEPGRTDWEGFDTATRAAVAGGITTLVDMPLNASPVTTTAAAFDRKLAAAVDQLHTDCGFWGGVIPGNEQEIIPLIDRGVLGFKAFLTHSGIDEFPNAREEDLRIVMPILARYGLPLLVHAELETAGSAPAGPGANPRSYNQYLASRPPKWEDDAIALMIRLCEEYGCRTHIVHLSAADSVDRIRAARKRGLPLTAETGQHYLYFSAEQIGDGQTLFKCAPPIRGKDNQEKLWDALKDGVIDFVATDHSPAPPSLKEVTGGDFTKAWGGISSLQLALPVLWTAARQRGISLSRLIKWLCSAPAALAGLSAGRGSLAPGQAANLVVWDPDRSFRVTEGLIQHRHKMSPYVGEVLFGVVGQTWLHGEKIFDKGVFLHPEEGMIILR